MAAQMVGAAGRCNRDAPNLHEHPLTCATFTLGVMQKIGDGRWAPAVRPAGPVPACGAARLEILSVLGVSGSKLALESQGEGIAT